MGLKESWTLVIVQAEAEVNCRPTLGIYPGELQISSWNISRWIANQLRELTEVLVLQKNSSRMFGLKAAGISWTFLSENRGIYLYDFCKTGFLFEDWPSSSGDGKSSVAMFCGCSVGIKINHFHQLCSVGPLLTTAASSALETRV